MDSTTTVYLPLSVTSVYSLIMEADSGYGDNQFVNGHSFISHTTNSSKVVIGDADYGRSKYYIAICK